MTTYTSKVTVDLETGEYMLDLPEEITAPLGWKIGDTLKYEISNSGQVTLKKVTKMKRFAVETISTFRHVYFIECESEEHALDTVAMEEAENSFQQYLGEQIVSAREVDKSDMIKIIRDTEQPNLTEADFDSKPWIQNCVHVVDYAK
jgi:hypothetical protein